MDLLTAHSSLEMQEQNIHIALSDGNVLLLNIALALVMFGVSLDLKLSDFRQVFRKPAAVIGGMAIQYIALPAMLTGFIFLLKPKLGFALGALLVLVSPGGNMSNFLTKMSRGDVALSVVMTAIATLLAAFATPGLFNFWSSFYTDDDLAIYQLNVWEMAKTVLFLTALPLISGMIVRAYLPMIAAKVERFMKFFSIFILIAIIVIAVLKNKDTFSAHLGTVFGFVAFANAMALALGYWLPVLVGAGKYKSKAISIETGIKNAGLSLVLIFNFWDGWGEPALIAAWWGIWHLITGFALAWWWGRKKD
jgi:BASS family bile acid:Na+ symporter